MEEYFDMEMYVHAKLNFDQPNRVWLLYQGKYVPFRRELACTIIEDGYMDDPAVCSNCGTHYDGGRYCKYCGARVVN